MKTRVILFGTGKMFQLFMRICNMQKLEIVALCDNNCALAGNKIEGYEVIIPERVTELEYDAIVVVNSHYMQVKGQLLSLGVSENKIWDFSCVVKNIELYADTEVMGLLKDDVYLALTDRQGRTLWEEQKERQEKNLFLNAKIFAAMNRDKKIKSLEEVEFQVFSQFGEDGIIQWLIHNMDIPNKVFVEFGVENYSEANTRFLLMNNNWTGLIMDGNRANIECVKNWKDYWKYDLLAKDAFITKENINELIVESSISGDIGLLSVDIDGNDYWVLQNITCIQPRILICEYNSVFGADKKVAVPYDAEFVRSEKHFSYLYWGASLKAYTDWAEKNGYYYVGSNSAGNNAFFVRSDCFAPEKLPEHLGYRESKYRESRDENGALNFLRGADRLKQIQDMEVVNLETGETDTIANIYEMRW